MKPGQTEHKLEVCPACPLRELCIRIKNKTGVEPERQVLSYNGKILDEHLDTKADNTLGNYITEYQGKYMYIVLDLMIKYPRASQLPMLVKCIPSSYSMPRPQEYCEIVAGRPFVAQSKIPVTALAIFS